MRAAAHSFKDGDEINDANNNGFQDDEPDLHPTPQIEFTTLSAHEDDDDHLHAPRPHHQPCNSIPVGWWRHVYYYYYRVAMPCLVIYVVLYFSIAVVICDAKYFLRHDDDSWFALHSICPRIESLFWSWNFETHHSGFPMWPSTVALSFLLVVIPSTILLLGPPISTSTGSRDRLHKTSGRYPLWMSRLFKRMRGDVSIRFWSLLLLVLPTMIVMWAMLDKPVSLPSSGPPYNDPWNVQTLTLKAIGKWANPAGYCATIALSLFLVPVSRQAPLLELLRISPALAVGFHIWAGHMCWIMTSVHGILYTLDIAMDAHDRYGGDNAWEKLKYELFPIHSTCWSWEAPWKFASGDSNECYHQWRNTTGIISALALLMLIMTSWNWIRRRHYRIFYLCHVCFGSIMLLFAVLHFYWIALYLVPGLIYYLACTLPVVMQHYWSWTKFGGIQVTSITDIPNSNGCYEIQLASVATNSPSAYPCYVRICVPEISILWHPFTVAHPNDLKLMIREFGPFTQHLRQRLCDPDKPDRNDKPSTTTILIDGFYAGPDWVQEIYHHDTCLLVAAGIGITPILSVLLKFWEEVSCNAASSDTLAAPACTRTIHIHWYCRDASLVEHVWKNYLQPVLLVGMDSLAEDDQTNREKPFRIAFYVHLTSQDDIYAVVASDPFSQSDANEAKSVPLGKSFEGMSRSNRKMCAGLMVVALGMHVVWYHMATWEARDRIFFRGYILLAVLGMGSGAAFLLEMTRTYHFEKVQYGPLLPISDETDDAVDNVNDEQTHCPENLGVPRSDSRFPETMEVQRGLSQFTLQISNGRPPMDQVIRPVVECSHPAVFYCGPTTLWETVSSRVKTGRRNRHGYLAPCTWFKEHFEI